MYSRQENGGNPARALGWTAQAGQKRITRAEIWRKICSRWQKSIVRAEKRWKSCPRTGVGCTGRAKAVHSGRKTAEILSALAEKTCLGRKMAEILPALPSAGQRRSRLRPKRLSRKRSGPPSLRPLTQLVPCASGEYVRMAEKKNTGGSYSIQVMSAVFWKGLSSRPITMAEHSVCVFPFTIVRSVSSFQT